MNSLMKSLSASAPKTAILMAGIAASVSLAAYIGYFKGQQSVRPTRQRQSDQQRREPRPNASAQTDDEPKEMEDVSEHLPSDALHPNGFRYQMEEFLDTYFQEAPENEPVISYIDTGFTFDPDDVELIAYDAAERVLRENFVEGNITMDDVDGHGTTVGRIMLRFTSSAKIEMKRISEVSDLCGVSDETFARAIESAGKADIIVFPLGLSECTGKNSIKELRKLTNAQKLILASASNGGPWRDQLWPSNAEGVIPVFSVDEFAVLDAGINPRPSTSQLNLAAYGSKIEYYEKGRCSIKSGTSFAVATAAAMMAGILDFARREVPDLAPHLLRVSCMEQLIRNNFIFPRINGFYHPISLFVSGFWDGREPAEVRDRLRAAIIEALEPRGSHQLIHPASVLR